MKKTVLILAAAMMVFILSSCSMLPVSKLEAMFAADQQTQITSVESGLQTADLNGDTVTISREEYEQYRQFSEMFEIYNAINGSYWQEPDDGKLVEYATRGLMAGLDDPYSYYYNPEEYAKMWEDDDGNYVGIGVLISSNMETKICTITRVFKGGPAEKAGVQRGDILYKVGDDLYVTADNLQDAVNIMRGEPDTDVNVTFLRGEEEITYTITRTAINVNQVESGMLDKGIGYIAFYEFAGQGDIEFEKALNELLAQGAEGIIIDLRDNGGGWVDMACNIADLFMDDGELCYVQYRDGDVHPDEYRTHDGKADVKLVILINENTASSSEILTGALREKAGAVTVGVNSYGKGIIQGVYPVGVNGAGYQMTIAQYYTPNGTAVHKVGIAPDYEIPLPEGDNGNYDFADMEKDVQLIKAVEVMKSLIK